MSKNFLFIQLLIFLFLSNLNASIDDYFKKPITPSPSNYGNTGILELPNASFMEEGSLRFSFSSSFPNEFTSLTASPFPWLEATYRYTEVKNQLYGPSAYSGNQSFKDKGFDIKIRLLKEGFINPSVAVGLRDIAGTAQFASEYLVATKSVGSFDLTAGLGWGLLGLGGTISNPLASFNEGFKTRGSSAELGGDFNAKDWFSGQTSLFSGIEYDLKKYGLRFALEYDTSNPDINPNNPVDVKSRFNFGVNYYLSNSFNIGLAFERGQQARVSFALTGLFSEDIIPKPKPKNVIPLNAEQLKRSKEDKGIFYRSLNKSLQDEQIYIQGASYNNHSVDVAIGTNRFVSHSRSAGRSARITSALTGDEIETINIHHMNGDFEVITYSLNRKEFDQALEYSGSSSEILNKSTLSSNSNNPLYRRSDFKPSISFPEFNWSMSPALKHQIGGPEGFYLGQLSWKTDMNLKLRRNLTIYSSYSIKLYDTFNNLINASYSELPHVRSDIQNYLSQGKNGMQRLQLEYVFSPIKDVFVRADVGYFEEMFGGIGGEIIYRPFNYSGAIGLSLHKVKQRGFKQKFSFRNYETTTGHLSFYNDLPYEITSQVMVGKYLAGDTGATIDLSRRFKTGFTLGVFATKTNVSKELFGEGSFDKGFYFSIPVNLFYADYTTGNISFGLHPLTKDGGAILNQHHSLFGILGDTNRSSALRDWGDLLD